jgi:hypothetical protein
MSKSNTNSNFKTEDGKEEQEVTIEQLRKKAEVVYSSKEINREMKIKELRLLEEESYKPLLTKLIYKDTEKESQSYCLCKFNFCILY